MSYSTVTPQGWNAAQVGATGEMFAFENEVFVKLGCTGLYKKSSQMPKLGSSLKHK